MCGITGAWGKATHGTLRETVVGMVSRLRHRGPDASECWVDDNAEIALGHTRLAIIDCSSAGTQPMHSSCGRYVLTYNGEIYNHLQIRRALEKDELIQWRGHSDSETLVECIARWGVERTLDAIEGMFAFGVWDRRERILSLARDRFGEKPLYYGYLSGLFVFSSELKALSGVTAGASVNRGSVDHLLRYGYIPAPMSIFRELRKLEPGRWAKVKLGEAPIIATYWDAAEQAGAHCADSCVSNVNDAIELIEDALRTSVSRQMVSDVPLGAFLSGGVDSSLVVALMQDESRNPISTFTIGFDEEKYDESKHADVVAGHLGTQHTCMMVTAADALAIVPQLPEIYCEPFADSSQIPTIMVSRMAAMNVKVALSGDGADELFGGYNSYRFAPRLMTLTRFPSLLKELVQGSIRLAEPFVGGSRVSSLQKLRSVIGACGQGDFIGRLQSHWDPADSVVLDTNGDSRMTLSNTTGIEWDLASTMMLADLQKYLPDDVLVKVDRAAMSASMETRAPFLCREVYQAAWSIPVAMKIQPRVGKFILRKLLMRYVPREIVERPKKGFSVPLGSWLRGPLREWADWLLATPRLLDQGILDATPVSKLWNEHLSGARDNSDRLWPILMFQAWIESRKMSR